MRRWLLAFAVLAACNGETGTLSITLTMSPGAHVLDDVQTLRLTVTEPPTTYMIPRTADGFDLSVDLPTTGQVAALRVDGLDAQEQVIAAGASPAFPVGPLDAHIAIFMAPPDSITPAPVKLSAAATGIGVAPLSYGAVLAGGATATAPATDTLAIYNAFDHTLLAGKPLPVPRAQPLVGVGARNIVYLFGGLDTAGTATDTFWRFDTSVAPNGAYADFGSKPGFARAGEALVPLGSDRYIVTGSPVGIASGTSGVVDTRTEVAALPRTGATVIATDSKVTTVFVDASGVTRFRDNTFDVPAIAGAARTGHAVVAAPDGRVLVVCGAADALRIDAAAATAETFPSLPRTPRTDCAVATTSRHLLIAGGTGTGGPVLDAEVYDLATLQLVATIPLAGPRVGATAVALPNDQVLLLGGDTASDLLELFTPRNP